MAVMLLAACPRPGGHESAISADACTEPGSGETEQNSQIGRGPRESTLSWRWYVVSGE